MSKSNYTEKEISTNLLIRLKHMKAEFNTFAQEAGSDTLYDSIMDLYTSVSTLQRDVFNMMCNQNWYVMKPDTPANVSKAYTKFANMESELS